MAESTPLLTETNSAASNVLRPASLDDTIERCIGRFGWAQFLQAALVSFAWVFDAQQTFITIFTDSEPTWHCTHHHRVNTFDLRVDSVCNSSTTTDICSLPRDAWSWDLPPHVSVLSEWGPQCAGSFVKGLPASSFFFGCLIGGLALATLADSSLGRKNMLLLSCLMMSLSSVLTVLSSNIWIYAFLRFVSGFGRATIGTCALVLSTELVGKKWRGQVGVMGFFCFTFGFLSLPAIAYLNKGKSWRVLYVWTSVPTILYCGLVWFFVRESPRWLFVRGRKDEAITILKSMASPIDDITKHGGLITVSFSSLPAVQENSNHDVYSTIKILLEKKWVFRRLSAVMAVGVGIGMVYYGMPLALSNLNFNIYLSVTFNALSELPVSLIIIFLIDKLNRRSSLIVSTALSGTSSILIAALDKFEFNMGWLQIGLELVSFFGACAAFNMGLIYTVELFPTCVRNSAISMVRQALVLGGVFGPVLVAAGRKNTVWSYGVFGLVIGLCGLFVVGLPETKGSVLSDTLDEEEHKENRTNTCLV